MDRTSFEAAVYELRVAWFPDTSQVYFEPTVLNTLKQNLKFSIKPSYCIVEPETEE